MKKYMTILALIGVIPCYGMIGVAEDNQTVHIEHAKELVTSLREQEPRLLLLMDTEETESSDSCFGDDSGYSESDVLYSEVSIKWKDLRILANKIRDEQKKAAILRLFTPDDDKDYDGVLNILQQQ